MWASERIFVAGKKRKVTESETDSFSAALVPQGRFWYAMIIEAQVASFKRCLCFKLGRLVTQSSDMESPLRTFHFNASCSKMRRKLFGFNGHISQVICNSVDRYCDRSQKHNYPLLKLSSSQNYFISLACFTCLGIMYCYIFGLVNIFGVSLT